MNWVRDCYTFDALNGNILQYGLFSTFAIGLIIINSCMFPIAKSTKVSRVIMFYQKNLSRKLSASETLLYVHAERKSISAPN
jgi:hypothetical protein